MLPPVIDYFPFNFYLAVVIFNIAVPYSINAGLIYFLVVHCFILSVCYYINVVVCFKLEDAYFIVVV
ncbi:hypothetical protein CDL62_15750 [Alkalitalea saponilacus]|nr:hypothetical protein CDL62_15750 [Alkalitalea saponilacus]